MMYSPIFELYFKHEKIVHDFLVQLAILLIVTVADVYSIDVKGINSRTLSLVLFIILYNVLFYVIRGFGAQKLFGGLARYGPLYNTTLAVATWFIYLVMVRSRMMERFITPN